MLGGWLTQCRESVSEIATSAAIRADLEHEKRRPEGEGPCFERRGLIGAWCGYRSHPGWIDEPRGRWGVPASEIGEPPRPVDMVPSETYRLGMRREATNYGRKLWNRGILEIGP